MRHAVAFIAEATRPARVVDVEQRGLRVRARHREVVRPLVERYHGEWIESPGDQTLSTFPTALNAVNSGLAIQEARFNPFVPALMDRHPPLRVGRQARRSGDAANGGMDVDHRRRKPADWCLRSCVVRLDLVAEAEGQAVVGVVLATTLARQWQSQGKTDDARALLAPISTGSLRASTRST